MKDSDFQLLLASIRQAGRIKRGEMTAEVLRPEEVEAIQAQFHNPAAVRQSTSHLDVAGAPLGLTAEEIIESLRETRAREGGSV